MISVYVRSEVLSPSSYYRILQYTKALDGTFVIHQLFSYSLYNLYLRSKGTKFFRIIQLICFIVAYFNTIFFLLRDYINKPSHVIISREIMPRYLLWPLGGLLERIHLQSQIIWDFDDHILLGKEISVKEFNLLSKLSKTIVVTNEYLRNTIDSQYYNKVVLMPTTDGDCSDLDIDKIINNRIENLGEVIYLIWIATAANMPHLVAVIPILEAIAKDLQENRRQKLVLNIVSNSFPLVECKNLMINNIEWSRQKAIEVMLSSHIGIMPLKDNEYTKGKGGFKLIQYMSVGLPVIASAVGFNEEIVDTNVGFLVNASHELNSWENAILNIIADKDSYLKYGRAAYQKWLKYFSYESNFDTWRRLLSN